MSTVADGRAGHAARRTAVSPGAGCPAGSSSRSWRCPTAYGLQSRRATRRCSRTHPRHRHRRVGYLRQGMYVLINGGGTPRRDRRDLRGRPPACTVETIETNLARVPSRPAVAGDALDALPVQVLKPELPRLVP